MEQKTEFEVVIVGAGPSGLAAALTLLAEGISDIIVMERFAFPRYKCCAGYITGKTKAVYETFGLNIEEAHYSLIKEFNIFYRLKKRQTIANQFLYTNRMIDRVELDNAFAELAKSKGIRIKENTTISEHDADKKELKLSNGERLTYQKIIFADGMSGFGSRLQPDRKKNIAMQLVFPHVAPEEIQIHFGVTKRGYGWVSSYGGFTNVGLTDVFDKSVNYHEVFACIRKMKKKFALMRALQKIFYLKFCQVCVFDIGCRCCHRMIAYVFNHFFVNKK